MCLKAVSCHKCRGFSSKSVDAMTFHWETCHTVRLGQAGWAQGAGEICLEGDRRNGGEEGGNKKLRGRGLWFLCLEKLAFLLPNLLGS